MIIHKHSTKTITTETNTGEILVENRGYLTVEQQVKMMLDAGKSLADQRAIMYQYDVSGEKLSDLTGSDLYQTRKGNFDKAFALKKEINRRYVDKFKEQGEKINQLAKEQQIVQEQSASNDVATAETKAE